ncbi:hypothetical protein [uncultured Nostoc sp.]|uniref:hypothetical protein n=1 Tax=uncultured Nostoc sp. TaxID=340711 RepID=UPI0035CC13EB
MRLNKLLLPVILVGSLVLPGIAQAKQVRCEYKEEEPSKINRVVPLMRMGIKITIPSNHRAIAKKDGSVELLDSGTYNLLNCLANNPGAKGDALDYYSLIISKSKTSLLNDGLYQSLENNKIISWIIKREGESIFHTVKLRIKSKKGLVEVEQTTLGPITSEAEAKEEIKGLVEIAKHIEII